MGLHDPGSNPGIPTLKKTQKKAEIKKTKMPTKSKKTKSAGRFGARYGKKPKDKLVKVEIKQRIKQKCPFCQKLGAKRKAKGIWDCSKCGKKFAEGTYYIKEE